MVGAPPRVPHTGGTAHGEVAHRAQRPCGGKARGGREFYIIPIMGGWPVALVVGLLSDLARARGQGHPLPEAKVR